MQQPEDERPAPSADPETLMAGYQAGDVTSATALIRHASPKLLRLFASDVVSRAHAHDLLQETWLRIHRVRHTYQQGEPVLPWFYAIARYVRIDHYRKIRRTSEREESWSLAAEDAAVASQRSSQDELDALLAPLTPGEREVITMLKVVGMSLDEVARATSSSVGSVKQKVHRAYEKLRKCMRDAKPGTLPT